MWIFCGGMPRSGSTLQFHLTAHLVEHAGRGTRVEWVRPEEFPCLRDKYAEHDGWKVFKTHVCTAEVQAEFEALNAKGVYVFRDVRDVVVSRMRKGGQTFDRLWEGKFLDRLLTSFDRWTSLEAVSCRGTKRWWRTWPARSRGSPRISASRSVETSARR